jgi:hypothetical protein
MVTATDVITQSLNICASFSMVSDAVELRVSPIWTHVQPHRVASNYFKLRECKIRAVATGVDNESGPASDSLAAQDLQSASAS